MFFYFSQVKAKSKRFIFAALVFAGLAVILAGCNTDPIPEDDTNYFGSLPDDLVGTWETLYDSFEISRDTDGTETFTYDDGGYFGYEGIIMFVSNYDDESGVIIIKYTDSTNKDKPNPFHAVYYLKLSKTTVELNNTFGPGYTDADTTTLSMAVKLFTQGRMGNYMDFAFSTEYEKQ